MSDVIGNGNGSRHSRDLFSDRLANGTPTAITSLFDRSMPVPFTDGARSANASPARKGGASIRAMPGGRDTSAPSGVSIRGVAGLSIKGAAGTSANAERTEAKIRELFPGRAGAGTSTSRNGKSETGNEGKELFAGKARERRRAEGFY